MGEEGREGENEGVRKGENKGGSEQRKERLTKISILNLCYNNFASKLR